MLSIGSSPRVWGTPEDEDRHYQFYRFIPTRVGNSSKSRKPLPFMSVHPHACGELFPNISFISSLGGSSPRVWGTLYHGIDSSTESRFIPTRVGNSAKLTSVRWVDTVHPHACGELLFNYNPQPINIGSSPRVWGTLCSSQSLPKMNRFIPTRVGNSI